MRLNNVFSPRVKSFLKFFLGLPLTVLSFIFIFRSIVSSWDDVVVHIADVNHSLLFLGFFFLVLFFFLKSLSWAKILKALGYPLSFKESYFLLSFSETKRYIPGNIFAVIARVQNFEKLKVPKRIVFACQWIEMLLILITSALVAIPGVFYTRDYFDYFFIPFYISSLTAEIIFFSLVGVLLGVLIASMYFIRKRILLHHSTHISYSTLFDSFFVFFISWVFFGVGNYLVISAFFPLQLSHITPLSSFFVLSWFVGFLSFVTPMGLGVREVVVTVGLNPFFPLPLASAAAVISRLFLIFSELFSLSVSYFYYKFRPKSFSNIKKLSWQAWVLVGLVTSYISYFTYLSFLRYTNFHTGRYDLGNMDQTVWNTLHGNIFQFVDPRGTELVSRLSVHADFILILLAPFYLIWEDPRMLLLIQTVVLGIGAVFVYLLANKLLKHKTLSLVFAFSYLLNFWLQRQNTFDFHAVALATTFLLATFYFLQVKRYFLFILFLILALLTKENVYIVAFFFGVYIFLQGKKVWGFFLSVASFVIFYLLVAHLIPAAQMGNDHFALSYYSALGDTPAEVITTTLLRPDIVGSILIDHGAPYYLYQTLIPVGFLSLLSPLYLLFASGDFLINLISENYWLRGIYFHYAALIIPFVYISAIYGARRVHNFKIRYVTYKTIAYYLLFFSVLSTYFYGILPGVRWPSVEFIDNPLEYRHEMHSTLMKIPKDMSISASNSVASHLSYRENIYVHPIGREEADVIAFIVRPSEKEYAELVDFYRDDPSHLLVHKVGGLYIFAKDDVALRLEALIAR